LIHPLLYEGDPVDALKIDEFSKRIVKDVKEGLFTQLINKYLTNNTHQVILRFKPDEKYMEE